jgi:RNA polymerase sigma factor (sigma-70 family)
LRDSPLIHAFCILTLTVMAIDQTFDIPVDDDALVAEIVASKVDGDRDKTKRLVEVLYRRHSSAVYARLASLASSSQVDDLAQESWIRILEKLHLYKEGNFRAWALTIARHHFLDWARAKRPTLLNSEVDVADGRPDRDRERSTRSEWAQILRECLAKLNERHREVVVGIIYEQSDYKALCDKLGITANEAYKLKHEAKELLANCCQRANR